MEMVSDIDAKQHASIGWKHLALATPIMPTINDNVMGSAIWKLRWEDGKYIYGSKKENE